jgi:hypothetical protein
LLSGLALRAKHSVPIRDMLDKALQMLQQPIQEQAVATGKLN